jgi:transposase
MITYNFSTFRDSCTSFYFMARTFGEDLKWRVVYLYYDGYSRRKIAKLLYISKSVVDKVLQIYTQWGTIVNPWRKPPGRHKTLNRNEMMVICEVVNEKGCILLF